MELIAMKRMVAYVFFVLIFASIIGIVIIPKINYNTAKAQYVEGMNSEESTTSFLNTIGKVQDLNQGITIFTQASWEYDTESEPPYYYNIAILNHTDEPIDFPNEGFGIEVYSYDSNNNSWYPVEIGVQPRCIPIQLGKGIGVLQENNRWILNEKFLDVDRDFPVRIYVSGKGSLSNKKYGAYLDIELSQ
jgi:hypothetical protein